MRRYHKRLVISANEIGLVTEAAFLDACQELLEAQTIIDIGSVFTAHLATVRIFGEEAVSLYTRIHHLCKEDLA